MNGLFDKTAGFITAAFSLVAALAWNDTIKAAIERYIQPGSTLLSMFIYAILVTAIAIIASISVTKFTQKLAKSEEKLEKRIIELENKLKARK